MKKWRALLFSLLCASSGAQAQEFAPGTSQPVEVFAAITDREGKLWLCVEERRRPAGVKYAHSSVYEDRCLNNTGRQVDPANMWLGTKKAKSLEILPQTHSGQNGRVYQLVKVRY